jgi:hypothetical protein
MITTEAVACASTCLCLQLGLPSAHSHGRLRRGSVDMSAAAMPAGHHAPVTAHAAAQHGPPRASALGMGIGSKSRRASAVILSNIEAAAMAAAQLAAGGPSADSILVRENSQGLSSPHSSVTTPKLGGRSTEPAPWMGEAAAAAAAGSISPSSSGPSPLAGRRSVALPGVGSKSISAAASNASSLAGRLLPGLSRTQGPGSSTVAAAAAAAASSPMGGDDQDLAVMLSGGGLRQLLLAAS